MTGRGRRIGIGAAFVAVLGALLLRAVPYPATLDSIICAASVAEFRPGFLDGKPAFAVAGQAVRAIGVLLGGDRATLMRLLGLWCALFAWGMLALAYLLGKEIHGGSAARGLAAAALLGSTPVFAFMSAIVEKYTVQLVLVLWAALLWMRRRYPAWGLVWGAALGAHVTSALLAVPCLFSLLRDPGRRGDARRAATGALLALPVAAPLYLWVLAHTEGPGAYVAYVRRVVLGEYAFLQALHPGRLLRAAAAGPAILVAAAATAAAAALALGLARRRGGGRPWASVWPAAIAAAGLAVGLAYRQNLNLIVPQIGWPLLALTAAALPAAFRGGSPHAGFLGAWLVTHAIFVVVWDHFYGQFAVYIVAPLALTAAGIGAGRQAAAPGRRPAPARRLVPAAVVLAAAAGLWISRGAVERGAWTILRDAEPQAREAAATLPPGGLVVAAWDGAVLGYYAPGLDVMKDVPGEQGRPLVWKGTRRRADVPEEIRRAFEEGRAAYVTRRWLDQKGDAAIREARERILRSNETVPAAPGIFRLVPRDG